MRNTRITTLRLISTEDLTECWNRCWQGYFYNMTYTHDHLRVWLYLSHVSLEHSCAVYSGNKIVGFCLLSLDGTEGWIAGTCIDPEYRQRGLFGLLIRVQLQIAKRLGLTIIYLEVLKQNFQAFKVYQSVGFTTIRELNIYRAENRLKSLDTIERFSLESVSLKKYFQTRVSFFTPSWQRKENYLRRYQHCQAFLSTSQTAGLLFTGENNIPLLDIWSLTSEGAEEVISYQFSQLNRSFSLTNQPKDWIVGYLSEQGIPPCAQQYEMGILLT